MMRSLSVGPTTRSCWPCFADPSGLTGRLIFFSSLMHGPRQRRVICIVQDGKGKSTGQQTANLNLSHQHCDCDSTICTAHGFEAVRAIARQAITRRSFRLDARIPTRATRRRNYWCLAGVRCRRLDRGVNVGRANDAGGLIQFSRLASCWRAPLGSTPYRLRRIHCLRSM